MSGDLCECKIVQVLVQENGIIRCLPSHKYMGRLDATVVAYSELEEAATIIAEKDKEIAELKANSLPMATRILKLEELLTCAINDGHDMAKNEYQEQLRASNEALVAAEDKIKELENK